MVYCVWQDNPNCQSSGSTTHDQHAFSKTWKSPTLLYNSQLPCFLSKTRKAMIMKEILPTAFPNSLKWFLRSISNHLVNIGLKQEQIGLQKRPKNPQNRMLPSMTPMKTTLAKLYKKMKNCKSCKFKMFISELSENSTEH